MGWRGRNRVLATGGVLWPAHLGADLRGNVQADVLVQVLVLALWFWHLRAGWLLVVWFVRWVVVAVVVAAQVLLRRRARTALLLVLVGGHWFGTVATIPIVPEVVPLSMFVIIGDLLAIARYDGGLARRHAVGAAAALAGVSAMLSLQRWTGLADRAPRALFVAFIVGHAVGTGWLLGRQAATGRTELLANAAALQRAGRRLAVAGIEQRRAIAAALRAGPARRLRDLGADVEQLRVALAGTAADTVSPAGGPEALAERVEQAVADAQRASAELRNFSHGVFPASLGRHGLGPALRAAAARTPFPLHSEVRGELDEEAATFAFFTVDGALRWAMSGPTAARAATVTAEQRPRLLVIDVRLDGVAGSADAASALCERLEDRLNAAGADATVRAIPDGLSLRVLRPATKVTGPATRPRSRSRLDRWMSPPQASTATWVTFAVAVAVSVVIAVAAPELLPIGAAASMAPLFVGLPQLRRAQLLLVGIGQCVTGGAIATVSLLRTPAWQSGTLPVWLALAAVGVGSAAVVAAVGALVLRTHAQPAALAEELQASHQRLIAADDRERRRIERDLHDGGQQQLVALSIQLRALARSLGDRQRAAGLVTAIGEQVREAERDLARLADGAAEELLAGGLVAALGRLATAHRVRLDQVEPGVDGVDEATALALYFCVAEAVQNARKHAGAGATVSVAVRLGAGVATAGAGADHVRFSVDDDGAGFDPAMLHGGATGSGLVHLRDRLAALGGELSIRSAPGRGTTVTGRLPLSRSSAGTVPVGVLSVPTGTAAPL
ncbi:MAG: sensor histidine kinase [Acidimicrobiia bacterium]